MKIIVPKMSHSCFLEGEEFTLLSDFGFLNAVDKSSHFVIANVLVIDNHF